MSIILDALKKLEQKRQQDTVPNLSTIHTPNLHKPRKRPLWPYLLLVALLINAGILTAWLRPWSSAVQDEPLQATVADHQDAAFVEKSEATIDMALTETTVVTPAKTAENPDSNIINKNLLTHETVVTSSLLNPADEPALNAVEKPVPDPTEPASAQLSPDDQVASLDLSPSLEELETLKETIREERELEEKNKVPAHEPSSDNYDNKQEIEILELSELSSDVKKEIPDISIIGHIYSSRPSSRLANINGSIVREGDTITGKLKVKEITMTGVIFDYDGLHFRVRAF